MNDLQTLQTIALDLKRGANYLHAGRKKQAEYYLSEARQLYDSISSSQLLPKHRSAFIKFEGDPEDILLGSSIISGSICTLDLFGQ